MTTVSAVRNTTVAKVKPSALPIGSSVKIADVTKTSHAGMVFSIPDTEANRNIKRHGELNRLRPARFIIKDKVENYLGKGLHLVLLQDINELERPARWYDAPDGVEFTKESDELDISHYTGKSAVSAVISAVRRDHIGSDPEIFAVNEDGSLIPSFEFLPEKGAPAKGNRIGSSAYWDGFQGEFSTVADTCLAFHMDSVQSGLATMTKLLRSKFPNASLTMKNTFTIPQEVLDTTDPKFVEFGCKPSLNAYGARFIIPDGRTVNSRSAGGHMHFTFAAKTRIKETVKALDNVLGIISVSLFQYWDSPIRRAFYGRAGEYRVTPYGFEYRVLSNAWMAAPALSHFVFEIARRVLAAGMPQVRKLIMFDVEESETQRIINECDVEAAKKVLQANDEKLTILLSSLPINLLVNQWKNIIFNGAHKHLKNPDVPSSYWQLHTDGAWSTHSAGSHASLSHTYDAVRLGQPIG